MYSGADPGFPVGGGANPPEGAPTYDFAKFREKLHEIEKILGHRGARPLKSTTGTDYIFYVFGPTTLQIFWRLAE